MDVMHMENKTEHHPVLWQWELSQSPICSFIKPRFEKNQGAI